MALIGKVATAWSGTTGGPGLNQLYIEDTASAPLTQAQAQAAVNAVRGFWDAAKGYLPDEVTLTVQPVVDSYNPVDGELSTTITAAMPPANVVGTSATAFSMAAGCKVNLHTNIIRNGRRVRGSIYVVPTTTAAMTTSGLVLAAARTALNTAGANMITALAAVNVNLVVWGRPVFDEGGTLTRAGTVNYVQTFETSEKTAILRGRRD